MENKIPKRFIRIWIGNNKMPLQFEKWWQEFKQIHPDYEFITITNYESIPMPDEIKSILKKINSCAGISDVVRILALYHIGGIYIDTDVMPIKSFDLLIDSNKPFLGKRSSKSFESAIIRSPKHHPALLELINKLPSWFYKNINKTASVQTGPTFVSSVLFGREDVTHLPIKTFYPYNGFLAPHRNDKIKLFNDKSNFPEEMICAHFSNHRWGNNPNK
jgi:mannosyltransferase OCH1-like enzyme